ncbi:MAG: insulinase family protein, partial [Puniceicoccales bacterium]|nr:insulinase family protein [Puniceicoccales bacterium]
MAPAIALAATGSDTRFRPTWMVRWIFTVFALGLGVAHGFAMDKLPFEWSEEVPVDGAALVGRLANGLHYFILPHREPPNMASVRLIVAAGSLMESEDQRGIAHFLEHIAFCGSENFSKGDLIEFLQRMGMKFGSHSNAYTSFAETVYKLELPDCGRQTIKDSLLVLRDYLGALSIDRSEIDRERGVILSELRYVDSPHYRDALERYAFHYPHSTISKRFPIGEKSAIESFNDGAMRDFYEKFYVPSNAALVIVGDLDCEAVEKSIRFLFGDLPSTSAPAHCDIGILAATGTRFKLHSDKELPQVRVSICCSKPVDSFVDGQKSRRENMLQDLANSILTRRLEIISKQPDAAIIDGDANLSRLPRNTLQMAEIQAITERDKIFEATRLVEQELRRALEYGFTAGEVDRARREMAARFENARKQEASLQSSRLANNWVRTICSGRAPTSATWNSDFAAVVLKNATAEDIWEAFRASWAPKNRSIYVSGNLPDTVTENALRGTYMRSQRNILRPPAPDAAKQFAYGNFGHPGEIVGRAYDEGLSLHTMQFANGVRLSCKKTAFETGQVHIRVRFGRGLLSQPKDSPGLARFAEFAFEEGGLGRHSAEELRDLFAGHILSADFSVGLAAFQLDGKTTTDDILLQLQLLAAYVSDPGFRPEGEIVAHKLIPQMYVELDHTDLGALARHCDRFIHCN